MSLSVEKTVGDRYTPPDGSEEEEDGHRIALDTMSEAAEIRSHPGLAIRKKDFGFLPIPKSKRHDPNVPPEEQFGFTWRMNLVFAGAATVTVMNLYYIQPMLVDIANDFGVTYDRVSNIPTLVQAGYGSGILLITPLGDLLRRRQVVLLLVLLTAVLSIGLARAGSVKVLEGISFLVGMFSVTPQMCIPWTADLAPSRKRATAMSITLSGLILGLALGRVLGGVLAQQTTWRNTYWLAVGLQGGWLGILYLTLPDTPDKNLGLSYLQVLWSMVRFMITYPTLVQACLIAFMLNGVSAGLWTTLTFVLSEDPYNYSPLVIGLFGLIGLLNVILAPLIGKAVDKTVPWYGQLTGICIDILAMLIGLFTVEKSVGVICIVIALFDIGLPIFQVSATYRIAGIDSKSRARLNSCFLLCLFVGQTSGTAIMTKIYNTKGWTATGGCALAMVGAGLLILTLRGPHETGWAGWSGGASWKRRDRIVDESPNAITERSR
ncbi:membrane protein [Papiliotrema laurentii]|uniref:Membrane protein n=1 Tax=Papiliotrema laurentii TaxID=5418 RepID=A0AAD9FRM8_PAPLA|nr:membrane protein [Papiliotrema laurentii]